MVWIGIDTGHDTGLAVWDSGRRAFREVATMKIHKALESVVYYSENYPGQVTVVFEDARQRKWLPREKDESTYRGKLIGSGSVKRDAVIWQDFLDDLGIPYEATPPHKGLTKWTPQTFGKVTGWKGRTSNHARDAALLVFGR